MTRSLIADCMHELKGSVHDYETLLGSSLNNVWVAIGLMVEKQMRARRGVSIPTLGKFSFVRDLLPITPVFLLSDHFISSFGAIWRRPPPALLTPSVDLNMSVVGSDAGGIPKDHATKTLGALIAFIGKKLRNGDASGRMVLGNVGEFVVDGKTMAFHFNSSFVKSIQSSNSNKSAMDMRRGSLSTLLRGDSSSSLPRPLSLQLLDTSKPSSAHTARNPTKIRQSKNRRHHQGNESKQQAVRDRAGLVDEFGSLGQQQALSKSSVQLPLVNISTTRQKPISAGQILPRFMLPDHSHNPSQRVYEQQTASVQRTFEYIVDDHQALLADTASQEEEIDRRTKATRLRIVQERAQKAVSQRELDAFVQMQIEAKQRESKQAQAATRKSVDYDSVKVLPRGPIISEAQRRATKDKLRSRLHGQVLLKESLSQRLADVERAESAYFMSKVQEQAEREKQQSGGRQRIAREALVAGWEQQRVMSLRGQQR